MKVVIQCAASKHVDAGRLRTRSGEDVLFVAAPALCDSAQARLHCARPDDLCDESDTSWRDVLNRYNDNPANPFKLLEAANLYAPKEHVFRNLYQEMADELGWANVFILSAGWGLIRAGFLTPDYNITFSAQAKKKTIWAWRDTKDRLRPWLDFNHLVHAQIGQEEPIHFFGGKDYLPTFYALAKTVPGRKIVHCKGDVDRRVGFYYEPYDGTEKNRTWHYRAAKDFLANARP